MTEPICATCWTPMGDNGVRNSHGIWFHRDMRACAINLRKKCDALETEVKELEVTIGGQRATIREYVSVHAALKAEVERLAAKYEPCICSPGPPQVVCLRHLGCTSVTIEDGGSR